MLTANAFDRKDKKYGRKSVEIVARYPMPCSPQKISGKNRPPPKIAKTSNYVKPESNQEPDGTSVKVCVGYPVFKKKPRGTEMRGMKGKKVKFPWTVIGATFDITLVDVSLSSLHARVVQKLEVVRQKVPDLTESDRIGGLHAGLVVLKPKNQQASWEVFSHVTSTVT